MKCDELTAHKGDVYIPVYGSIADAEVYLKEKVDAILAKKDKEIAELKAALERDFVAKKSAERVLCDLMDCGLIKEWFYNGTFHAVLKADDPHLEIAELKAENERLKKQSSCTFSDDSLRVRQLKRKIADNSEKILELQKALDVALSEVYSLLDKIESLKASHYAESVDAGMRERRLKRALWIAMAERAKEFRYKIGFAISSMNTKYDYSDADKWQKVERKCRAKAEEYK